MVSATVYGHALWMPAEHPIAGTLAEHPQYNRPLGLAMEAIAATSPTGSKFAVIDVGANIGETISIIEQRVPRLCSYLCIEADEGIADLCMLNHQGNPRVQVVQSFIGEAEGSQVLLEDDGRANPSTKFAEGREWSGEWSIGQLVRLDTIAAPFAAAQGCLSLIKIDTEGYDFSVLRSAPKILAAYGPAVYIEWFPELLVGLGEDVCGGFEYLAGLGYRHFVFFTNTGDYYCEATDPAGPFLRELAKKAVSNRSLDYFDVFGSREKAVADRLVEMTSNGPRKGRFGTA